MRPTRASYFLAASAVFLLVALIALFLSYRSPSALDRPPLPAPTAAAQVSAPMPTAVPPTAAAVAPAIPTLRSNGWG